MKKFRFKYAPAVWILLVLVLLLSVGGLLWNIYNLIEFYSLNHVFKLVSYALIVIVCLFLTVFVLSVIFYGNYLIKSDTLYTCFGFFRSKSNIYDIVCLSLFKKSNKLVVYFKDQTYTVIVIDESLYDEFVLSLRKINPQIIYDTRIDGEDIAN